MDKVNVVDREGGKVGEAAVSQKLLDCRADAQLIHDVIVGYQRNQRKGSASTLTKGEVRGSGIKPWRQKGTGRARAGMRRSPLWRGGGVTFGPKPRDFFREIPKAMRGKALAALFADKIRSGNAVIVEQIGAPGGKTKDFALWLKKIDAGRKPLMIMKERNEEVARAARNIPGADVVTRGMLSAWLLAAHDKIVMEKGDFEAFQEQLG
ncbi:MAG: 50S ribosomal protein L4 [Candidatus Aureabacteria bacterium]|nr:50S ribosomal protein L4 [Candidatus Auribacterota bacterium]